MADAADKRAVMTENLRDIGFDDETTDECLMLVEQNRYAELEKLLKKYRETLLENVHRYNDRIDCLDYFTYSIRKQINGGTAK